MTLLEHPKYRAALERLVAAFPAWEALEGKCLFLSGGAGMIGSVLVDAVMLRSRALPEARRCRVIAAGRSAERAARRFPAWTGDGAFRFLAADVSEPLGALPWEPDFWVHAASTTHPAAYAARPVETVLTNVLGAQNLLERAARRPGSRFLLLSSVEIYGENRGGAERFAEGDCGYLDCNTPRAGYPEAKRASEALCQAYRAQYGADTVILRLPRCYGPSMSMDDSKAAAQFIKNAVYGEDIVLKSAGEQLYSYAHACDAALGVLWALLRGTDGEAYNLGDKSSDFRLKDLAALAAESAGTRVVFAAPGAAERRGYSTATKALLDAGKLKALGWRPLYDVRTGVPETIDILRRLYREGERA